MGFRVTLHSHSIVAGGLLEISKVTLEIPEISLIILVETWSRNSYGSFAQVAVIKSVVSTALNAMTY